WLTAITIDENKTGLHAHSLIDGLNSDNIEASPLWKPLHMQPLFKESLFYPHRDTGNISEQLFKTGICLPSGSNMKVKEQMHVINCIKETMPSIQMLDSMVEGISN